MSTARITADITVPALLAQNAAAQAGVDRTAMLVGSRDLTNIQNQDITSSEPLKINLVPTTTLGAARQLHVNHRQERIAILNMAAADRAAGGYPANTNEARPSQEEYLCMCTTLFPGLTRVQYPVPWDGIIHSPDVLVFRDKSATGLEDLAQTDIFYTDVLSCAALKRPQVTRDGKAYLHNQDRDIMKQKIEFVLRAAVRQGARRLVLGAFGCGSFANPAEEVARLMSECLSRTHWPSYGVVEVVIAVLDGARGQPIWTAFQSVFGSASTST